VKQSFCWALSLRFLVLLIMNRIGITLFNLCCISTAYGQNIETPSRWIQKKNSFYGGIEGIIFANHDTRIGTSSPFLAAGDKNLEPMPALLAGYMVTPRLAVEVSYGSIPVSTGFFYQNFQASDYFGSSYTNGYIYIPLRGVFQVLGTGHRVGLSVLAGGGLAFTNLSSGLPITPNGTTSYTVTQPDGSSRTVSYTQLITQEKTSFAVFEAGVRGHYFITPRLALNLTVRQLWSPTSSVRDIYLDINTPSDHLTTTMTTPLRGIATGLGLYYSF